MFTIKVLEEDGHEFVKSEVDTVVFNPPVPSTEKGASLFVWYRNGTQETIMSGKIYIMNENGKTVADYNIYPMPKSIDASNVK